MVKRVITIAGIVALLSVTGWFIYQWLHPSDEQAVRKRMRQLEEYVTKKELEAPARMAINVQGVQTLFAPRCSLKFERYRTFNQTYSSEEIGQLYHQVRVQFASLTLKLHDLQIDIISPTEAEVEFTANLSGHTKSSERMNELSYMRATLAKPENKWLINSIHALEGLEK